MAKRLVCLLLVLLTVMSFPMYAGAQEGGFTIFVDGREISDAHAVVQNGVTYVSAYNVSRALVPDTAAAWEGWTGMTLTGTGFTLSAQLGRDYVVCNGRYLYTPGQVILHPENGDLLLPVRVLARALGSEVYWDGATGVYLTSGGGPLESGDTFYDAESLRLLATVIRHEAGYQPLEGQIAVGNVLLNRAVSNSSTLYDVITQPNQFPGALNATPGEAHYIAAKLCLDGAKTVPDNAYWFNGAGKACWASRNKTLLCVIGGHAFYG